MQSTEYNFVYIQILTLEVGFFFLKHYEVQFWGIIMKWIDIVDNNISIEIINTGAATPLLSFKGELDIVERISMRIVHFVKKAPYLAQK